MEKIQTICAMVIDPKAATLQKIEFSAAEIYALHDTQESLLRKRKNGCRLNDLENSLVAFVDYLVQAMKVGELQAFDKLMPGDTISMLDARYIVDQHSDVPNVRERLPKGNR